MCIAAVRCLQTAARVEGRAGDRKEHGNDSREGNHQSMRHKDLGWLLRHFSLFFNPRQVIAA